MSGMETNGSGPQAISEMPGGVMTDVGLITPDHGGMPIGSMEAASVTAAHDPGGMPTGSMETVSTVTGPVPSGAPESTTAGVVASGTWRITVSVDS
jgi:hypothetical protein